MCIGECHSERSEESLLKILKRDSSLHFVTFRMTGTCGRVPWTNSFVRAYSLYEDSTDHAFGVTCPWHPISYIILPKL